MNAHVACVKQRTVCDQLLSIVQGI